MSDTKRFFSYNPDGFELHETAEEAKAAAEADFSLWTDGTSIFGGYLDIYWGEVRGMVHEGEHDCVGECSLVDLPPTPDPETERLRAELEAVQAELETVREAWAEVRGAAVACIEGDPYGNEAASLILGTMDTLIPAWVDAAPTAPEPAPIFVTEPAPSAPAPAPAPVGVRWDPEWKYDGRGVSWCRGTLTHLATGLSDTSGWWLDSGDAHAEAEQGLCNQLARSGLTVGVKLDRLELDPRLVMI